MTRVVLIENSPPQAAVFTVMLESAGFSVERADSLATGIASLEQDGIDALLLDLNLPDSEGLATFQAAFAKAGGTPIVVLTHVDDEELAATTLEQGAQDYLIKGEVNQQWLRRSIQHAISRGRSANATSPNPQPIRSDPPPMPVVQIETRGDVVIARITESQLFDAGAIALLSESLVRSLAAGCCNLVISLARVDYLSNGAMGVLLAVRRRMQPDGRVCLCEVGDSVYDQLRVRQFHRLFEIHDHVDTAYELLAAANDSEL